MKSLAALVLIAGCQGFFDPKQPCDANGSAAGAPITLAQSGFKSSNTFQTTFLALTLPLAVNENDVIVAVVGYEGASASISSFSDGVNPSYAVAIGPTAASMGWSQEIFITRSTAVLPGHLTIQLSLTTNVYARLGVVQYSNVDTAQILDGAVSTIGQSSSVVQTAPLTTTDPHTLLVVAGSSDFEMSGTLPGYNVRTSAVDFIIEDLEVRTTGTYSDTAVPGSNGNYVMQTVALRGL